ncbi:MAG: hypothetical protein NVSMB62_19700 [Acidobacteriaceae bacterium]
MTGTVTPMAIFGTIGTRNEDDAEQLPTGSSRGRFAAGTPDDVAALYTWANIQGARYRDFSGSRVRHREQIRAQAAEVLRDRARGGPEEELVEPARATFTESDEWVSGVAEKFAENQRGGPFAEIPAASSGRVPAADSRRAPVPRSEYAIREEPAVVGQRSFREELELRLRHAEEREPGGARFGESRSNVLQSGRVRLEETPDTRPRTSQRPVSGGQESGSVRAAQRPWGGDGWPSSETGSVRAYRAAAENKGGRWERVEDGPVLSRETEMQREVPPSVPLKRTEEPVRRGSSASVRTWDGFEDSGTAADPGLEEFAGPAWLYGRDNNTSRSRSVPVANPRYNGVDEPEDQRASGRWAALRGVHDESRGPVRTTQPASPGDRRAPLLAVLSLAGGVGKTSLVATLGRVLSASGERVALGDAAPYSLLPFYFGARDVRPGAKRMFAPPEGSEDAPIFVANYDLGRRGEDSQEQRQLVAEILRNGAECNRILLDLPASAEWLVGRMATLGSTMVVPLLPDMNSVIGVEAVERYFERMVDSDGRRVSPFYLLNQFDSALALHQDVREVLRRRVGERLLSFAVRRSLVVSEALAEGMTVVDYAPESPVARDYFDLAAWLRTVSPSAIPGLKNLRNGGR